MLSWWTLKEMSYPLYSTTLLLICSSTDRWELMHLSFMQLLSLTRFLTFNLIFIYSSLIFEIQKSWLPYFCPRLSRQNDMHEILHTVNPTHPIIGSYITWLRRLIHPGHISTPTYVPSKHSAKPIDHMPDMVDLTHLRLRKGCAVNLKCLFLAWELHGLGLCPVSGHFLHSHKRDAKKREKQ